MGICGSSFKLPRSCGRRVPGFSLPTAFRELEEVFSYAEHVSMSSWGRFRFSGETLSSLFVMAIVVQWEGTIMGAASKPSDQNMEERGVWLLVGPRSGCHYIPSKARQQEDVGS